MLVIVRELLVFKSSKIQTCSLQDITIGKRFSAVDRYNKYNSSTQQVYYIIINITFNTFSFFPFVSSFHFPLFSSFSSSFSSSFAFFRTRDICSLKNLTSTIFVKPQRKDNLERVNSPFPRETP